MRKCRDGVASARRRSVYVSMPRPGSTARPRTRRATARTVAYRRSCATSSICGASAAPSRGPARACASRRSRAARSWCWWSTTRRACATCRAQPRPPAIMSSGSSPPARRGGSSSRCDGGGCEPEEDRMAEPPVPRAVAVAHAARELWRDPVMRPAARRVAQCERAVRERERGERLREGGERALIEAAPDLADVGEASALPLAYVQRAQVRPRPCGVGPSADGEHAVAAALHLHPIARAPALVRGGGPLRDHALEPCGARRLAKRRAPGVHVIAVAEHGR